jgi:4a-hydroxytetrahydrobiopterin dehydratase
MSLKENKCEACRIGAPLVTAAEKEEFFKEIDGWSIIKLENVERLVKVFKFSDYQEAVTFSNAVAMLAEEEDHHPKIVLEWGVVEVSWWSHKIGGLHRNDFICAAKTDAL